MKANFLLLFDVLTVIILLQKFKEIGIDKEELISLGFFNET